MRINSKALWAVLAIYAVVVTAGDEGPGWALMINRVFQCGIAYLMLHFFVFKKEGE